MLLCIDTASPDAFTVALADREGVVSAERYSGGEKQVSETLLVEIDTLLRQASVPLKDLSGILVVKGPGGFTSLRAGVSTANALAFALDIPVVGTATQSDASIRDYALKAASQIGTARSGIAVRPEYGRPPNITQPKDPK